ncbi:MAG: CRISPR-associated protein Cas2 [Bacillota bacterium]|nr:CRISPR-associated protein Cas2 [Bacillota bacterium]
MDYGLDRIQWSAFLGDINHNRREELEARLKKVLGRRAGNIQLFPVCEKDLSLRVIIEVRKEDEKKDDDDKSKKRRRRKKKEKTKGSGAEAKVSHEPGDTGEGMQAEENLEQKRRREGGRA